MADPVAVNFVVNGNAVSDRVPGNLSLLSYLREKLRLTGAKNGCSKGHCGVCTVLMNGKATRSCLVRMDSPRLSGAEILTIEGLRGKDGGLHPIQQAFVDCGAIQCGFCTPGMVMSAKALLDENPDPTPDEIRRHFARNRNICRCTGYVKIIQAVRDAAARLRGKISPMEESPDDMPLLRRDAVERVTGRTLYGDDLFPEGVLYGKILWSAHPHARLLSIDTSDAENHRGVAAVVTARDIRGTNRIGLVERDQPGLVAEGEKVRFIGDPIAAVFAESADVASEALQKIRVEYEILPAVLSVEEAMKPGAPVVHEEKGTNLFHHARIERGDVEEALARAPVVVEADFQTSRIEHAFMEPECGVAIPDGEGGVVLMVPTQCVFNDQAQLCEALDLSQEKVRVVQLPIGGAFGAKEDMIVHVPLVLGALKTGHPVKIVLSREESLRVHQKRHPAWMHYRVGADREGSLLALDVAITVEKGAYAALGLDILENICVFAGGAYHIPAVRIDGVSWHTNAVMSGAMRGFGANQAAFAMESCMDMLARRLNMDPFEVRLRNALTAGLPTVADHVLEPGLPGLRETLVAVREELGRTEIPMPALGCKIGVGIACGVKNIGFGHNLPESSGAILRLEKNGRFVLKVTHHEYGQGGWAGEVRLAANVLGVPVDIIDLVGPDTAETPSTGPTTASRQTFMTGNAVVGACRSLLSDLRERGARALGVQEPARITLEGDRMIDRPSGRSISLEEIGAPIETRFRYFTPPTAALLPVGEKSRYGEPGFASRPTHWCYAYGTQAAIVEVDETSGEVRVLKVIASNDVGRVINRRAVEGQFEGGVVMGVGYAVYEQFIVEGGRNITDSLLKCGLVTADRAPEVVCVPVEVPHPEGPQGLKGLAEAPSLATAPAVINAIFDAVGARIFSLPATKEKVLAAIKIGLGRKEAPKSVWAAT